MFSKWEVRTAIRYLLLLFYLEGSRIWYLLRVVRHKHFQIPLLVLNSKKRIILYFIFMGITICYWFVPWNTTTVTDFESSILLYDATQVYIPETPGMTFSKKILPSLWKLCLGDDVVFYEKNKFENLASWFRDGKGSFC